MKFPLTAFLIDMLRGQLTTADAGKLAKRYGIRADWAAWYLQQWTGAEVMGRFPAHQHATTTRIGNHTGHQRFDA